MRRFGRDPLPMEVQVAAGLARGERVLAWAHAEKAWLLCTGVRLLVVADDGPLRDLPWQDVAHATWEQEERCLVVTETGRWGDERAVLRFAFAAEEEPVRLLQLVRERVTASIVLQRRHPVRGRSGITVHGRRPPAGGEVAWLVEYDPGLLPTDPDVRAVVDAALAAAQAEV